MFPPIVSYLYNTTIDTIQSDIKYLLIAIQLFF